MGCGVSMLPGGWKLKDLVYYTGASQTFPSGNKLVHGQQGEVTGPANGENTKGKGVQVLFPGNTGSIECLLTDVRRLRAPVAPAPVSHLRRSGARPILSRSDGFW